VRRSLRAFKESETGNCIILFLVVMGIIFILILVFSGGACCAKSSQTQTPARPTLSTEALA
jgi:hypothetical protein